MNRKLAFSRLLAVMFCLALAGQVAAQTSQVAVGVLAGNVFKYKVTYFWNSTNPSDPVPSNWAEANTTEYYQATVKEVTGTTVVLQTVQHFLNGTDLTKDNELIDVSMGAGGSLLVYAANLVEGSYLYPAATYLPWIINATVSRPYGSGVRETNWITVKMTDVESYVYRFTSLYFDKATGVLVDAYFEDVFSDMPAQTFSRTIVITESSMWTVGGSPSDGNGDGGGQTGGLPMEWIYGIIIAAVIVAVVAAVLVLRKRGKKKIR